MDSPSVPSLGPCTEADLIAFAQGSGLLARDARLALLRAYEPLIGAVLYLTVRNRDQLADARQAAYVGFLEAVQRYRPDRGASLGTYARAWVEGSVRKHLRADVAYAFATEDLAHAGDRTCREAPPETAVESATMIETVSGFVRGLPTRWQGIVRRVYWEEQSQADVARELGVTRAAINKTLAKVHARGRSELSRLEYTLYSS